MPKFTRAVGLLLIAGLVSVDRVGAQETFPSDQVIAGKRIFDRVCSACHSIGEGPKVGPDLKDIHKQRTRAWLIRWIRSPLVMAQKDSIGRAIFAEWNKTAMTPANLSNKETNAVVDYIMAASEGPGNAVSRSEWLTQDADSSSGLL